MAAYRELFEKMPDGVTLHDPADGSIVDTNQRFCDMLGYTRSELLEMDFDALHVDEPPYTSDRAEEHIRQVAAEGPQTFEWLDEAKDGERIPVEVHLRQTSIGGQQRILAVVRDISGRKERERELRRKNERLEEFASVVSHDLRNPLHVASGRLELARTECDSEHLDAVAQAHSRMETLIEDLLTLAREGEAATDVGAVSLPDYVEECWETVGTETATLENRAAQTVRADRSRLQQLLENLLGNAVDHGGEDVRVRVGDLDDGFYVVDSGPGIPEAERDELFEAGYSTAADGTGFGLYIVDQIADSHGWTVSATESDDGGARFEVTGVTTSE